MIKEFTQLWFDAKPVIKTRLEAMNIEDINTYQILLQIMLEEFNKIIEADNSKWEYDKFKEDIKQIDYGDYQGTLILVFARDEYQPSVNQTFYTYVEYGSCSGCDTLLHIIYNNPYCYDTYEILDENEKSIYDSEKKRQIEDLLTLCLHMVEHIKTFGSECV